MTEQEWLHGNDLEAMLKHLSHRVSERKFRLTECAFHRRFWHLLSDVRSRRAVEVAERYADGLSSKDELRGAHADAGSAFDEILNLHFPDRNPTRSYWGGAVSAAQHTAVSFYDMSELFPRIAGNPKRLGNMWNLVWYSTSACPIGDNVSEAAGYSSIKAEQAAEVVLLRDIFGNPFCPVAIENSCLSSNDGSVRKLAQFIYDARAFEQMPELADALVAAACTNADILAHCREPGPHVQGCWVVDLILGKD